MQSSLELTQELTASAHRLGFVLAGACPAVTPAGINRFRQWLAAGYAGQMTYLADRADRYEHPNHILDGARSILMLAMPYRTNEPLVAMPGYGRISRYAWGDVDYHDIIHQRLHELRARLSQLRPNAHARGVVDTAPMLEREFGLLAGLGWIGKNTLLLNKQWGSWFFLAALLTDQELQYDAPSDTDHCGTCRACLDACPTQAFPQPYVLDASKCISYLTIELREAIPNELRSGIQNWLFGCDVCQDVCPWNHKPTATAEPGFQPREGMSLVELTRLFELSDGDFRDLFRRTPLWRAKRRGILRNAAIILGNQRDQKSRAALELGLQDVEPIVREACDWALRQLL